MIDFALLRRTNDFVAQGYGNARVIQSTAVLPFYIGGALDVAGIVQKEWPVRPLVGIDLGIAIAFCEVQVYSSTLRETRVRPAVSPWAGVEIPVMRGLTIDVIVRYTELNVGRLQLTPGLDLGEGRLSGFAVRAGAGYAF